MTQPVLEPKRDPLVLVVEDEPRLRDLLTRALGDWGFDAAAVRSGEEALRFAETRTPDIAVVDLNLPGVDGLTCLEQLRARSPSLQAIVLTGFASLDAARRAIHLDVVEFLTKPSRLGELERALDRALRRLMRPPAAPADVPEPPSAEATTLHEVERRHILESLQRNQGNRTATAAELGISRRTLYYKLSEYQKQGRFDR